MEGKIMKKNFIKILFILITFSHSRDIDEATGWSFFQSQKQAFYMLQNITVNGDLAEAFEDFSDLNNNGQWDSGEPFNDLNSNGVQDKGDIVGAFLSDGTCVGWIEVSAGFTTIPLMGNDGDPSSVNYCEPGDIPYLLLFDRTYGSILNVDISNAIYIDFGSDSCPDQYENGSGGCNCNYDPNSNGGDCSDEDLSEGEDPNGDNSDIWEDGLEVTLYGEFPGWLENEIYVMQSNSIADNIFGCQNVSACNYDLSVTTSDGSCWYPVDGCSCDDPEGAEVDCAGICAGTALVDACGICAGGSTGLAPNVESDDSFITGPNADCAGVCDGSSYEDACGACDSDSSNDNLACTGCTDICADNYNQNDLFDLEGNQEGACSYTIPSVQNFSNNPGDCRLSLSWDSLEVCGPELKYEIYDQNDNFIKETSNSTTQILGLDPDSEFCYYIISKNENGQSLPSDLRCSVVGSDCGGFIGMQLSASISGWNQSHIDQYNYLGFSSSASDDYDQSSDVVEPPIGPNYWISLYFPHPDWAGVLGNNFTQDIRLEDYDFLSNNLQIWEGEILSNITGNAILKLDFLDGFIEAFENIPMYLKLNDDFIPIEDGMVTEFGMYSDIIKPFSILIGNLPPQTITNLSSIGGDLSAEIFWDEPELCCSSLRGRYPAKSYNVYFDTGENPINIVDTSYLHSLPSYETQFCFIVKAVNDAGEGPALSTCAITNENLDPIAYAGDDQFVFVEHDGDIETNSVFVELTGSGFDPEGSSLTYSWNQVSGDIDSFYSEEYSATFEVNNEFGNNQKVYVFELIVTDSYFKGNPSYVEHRSSSDFVSVIVNAEQNQSPLGPNPADLIIVGDGLATYTTNMLNDSNDYDAYTSYWVVPHDGSPATNEATILLTAESSSDPENDELTYSWSVTYEPEPFTDWNGDGLYSPVEQFDDLNGNGVWDTGIEFFESEVIEIDRKEGVYEAHLTITDVYGATATADIVVGVQGEYNEAPTSNAG
ncbi:MAG: hypothetical protein CBD97_00680, partial [Pelagibacteraceae bacterium TMED237]